YTQAIIGWCQGYFFDIGRSQVVQGEPTREQEDFLCLLRRFAEVQTEAMQVGRTFHDAAEVGMKYFVEENKEFTTKDFEAGVLGCFASYGHSLGLAWSRPYLREGEDMVIQPGMYIQVEAVHGRPGLGMGEAELGVEITKDGPRMLSLP
ncbi:MAG TPA: M24 family metallopeptidase, partial [Rhodospirillales bacterium]|nr:M24 family metallopeptidase [Rhodospirillales bacterium]